MRDEQHALRPEPPRDPEKLDSLRSRVSMPRKRPEDRIVGFEEFEMGFTPEDARNESISVLEVRP